MKNKIFRHAENPKGFSSMMKVIKQKPILPSLKEKRRYLVFEAIGSNLNFSEIKDSILNEMTALIGRIGMAKANVNFMEDWKNNRGIIKVNNKYVDYVKATFVCLKKVNKKEAIIRSIGVSGLLNKARSRYLA